MDQRCATCRWWRLDPNGLWWDSEEMRKWGAPTTEGQWGECAKTDGHAGYPANTASLAWVDEADSHNSSLTTHETFGCVQWESRE